MNVTTEVSRLSIAPVQEPIISDANPLLPLRVLLVMSPPYVQKCAIEQFSLDKTETCLRPGLLAETLTLMLKEPVFNMTLFDSSQFPPVESSTDLLKSGDIDCLSDIYTLNEARLKQYDFSTPLYPLYRFFVLPKIEQPETWLQLLNKFFVVFQPTVWFTTVGALLLCATLGFLISKYSGQFIRQRHRQLSDYHRIHTGKQQRSFWAFLRLAVPLSSEATRSPLRAVNILVIIIGVFLILLCNLYTGLLLGSLFAFKEKTYFSTFDEMLEKISSGELTLIDGDPQWLFPGHMRDSPLPEYQRLREASKNNPMEYELDMTKLLSKVTTPGGHHIWYGWASIWSVAQIVPKVDVCKVTTLVVPALAPVTNYGGMLCRKDYPHMAQLDILMKKHQGMIFSLTSNYYPDMDEVCAEILALDASRELKRLSMSNFLGVFLILMALMFLALMAFLFERIYGVLQRSKQEVRRKRRRTREVRAKIIKRVVKRVSARYSRVRTARIVLRPRIDTTSTIVSHGTSNKSTPGKIYYRRPQRIGSEGSGTTYGSSETKSSNLSSDYGSGLYIRA